MDNRHNQLAVPRGTDNRQKALIVDIDGTISHRAGVNPRDPYDMTRVEEDIYDPIIGGIAQKYYDAGYEIIVVSARDESARVGTVNFLYKAHFDYDALYMRANGDFRRDSEVKTEIYINHIQQRWDVEFVLDDRNQTVRAWRTLGLKCLQVSEGDF